jgi:predicted aldo/keto reductase-like oxidoreductase
MQRLQVDYLDFYQVWNICQEDHFQLATAPGNMVDGIRQAMDEGLVRHTGFTAHAEPELVCAVLERADWAEIMLVTYNMIDERYVPALTKARDKGVGTVVMNPIGGGRLKESSKVFSSTIRSCGAVSMPDAAIRFILAMDFVDTLISGISTISDVDATLASAARGPFERTHIDLIRELVGTINREKARFCTGCRYCMPCPQEVNIPFILDGLVQHDLWGIVEASKRHYNHLENEKTPWVDGKRANACTACGECVGKCTQQLDIPKLLERAVNVFEQGESSSQ